MGILHKDELEALHDQIDQLRDQLSDKDQTIRGLKRQKDLLVQAAVATERHVEDAFRRAQPRARALCRHLKKAKKEAVRSADI
jgi:predicted  nucleic acid-binding Zn-ribbon protein